MEEWKKYGRYEISSFGKVKSVETKKPKIIKLHCDGKGYLRYAFYENKKIHTVRIHLLVWDLFGDNPRDGMRLQVDHIDNNKLNNRIDNLQLLTNRENCTKQMLRLPKTSRYTGVSFDRGKYRSRIKIGKYYKHLGRFINEYDAHLAYQNALETLVK